MPPGGPVLDKDGKPKKNEKGLLIGAAGGVAGGVLGKKLMDKAKKKALKKAGELITRFPYASSHRLLSFV